MGKSGYDKNQLEVEMIHHHQIITKQEQQAIYYLKLESKIQPIQYLMSGQPQNAA